MALRGRRPGSLSYSVDTFSSVASGRITSATTHAVFADRCKKARPYPIVLEDLYRTDLNQLFERGANLYTVTDTA